LNRRSAQLKGQSIDRQDAIAALILEELDGEHWWDESFGRSPDLLANQTLPATISPHPKSLSRGERDFESCSLLPQGEGLGMRARVCSNGCLIWY
jgi:hypothetical protein